MFQISFRRARPHAAAILTAALVAGTSAWSSPIDGNDFQLKDSGLDNHLKIVTQASIDSGSDSQPSGNRLEVTIEGDRNGGWGQPWQTSLFERRFPAPGLLEQAGWNNMISLEVNGQENLFSISQTGSGNMATGQIAGFGNAASVVQRGQGNMAVFSQSGSGNSLAISQNTW